MEINDKLKHLSLDSIEQLINLYYSGEKTVKELLDIYNIDSKPNELYKFFPPIEVKDSKCRHCGSTLYIKRQSKSAYRKDDTPCCLECGHKEASLCVCDKCYEEMQLKAKIEEKRKQDIMDTKRRLIELSYPLISEYEINYDELDFMDKLYLGTLCRHCITENAQTTRPINKLLVDLAPNSMTIDILRHLHDKEIIKVNPNSDIEAFVMDDNFPNSFYLTSVSYYLNIKHDIDKIDTLKKISNPKLDITDHVEIIYNIWREIALSECLEYLSFQMEKVHFDFNPGDKTMSVLNTLLDSFSISQIYCIIYSSITKATRYYQERSVSRKQAINSVITNCESYGEKALIDGWNVTKYTRLKMIHKSSLCEFLFNKVFKIGDKYFDEVPSIEFIESYINELNE